eukprot:GSMAST32.ASY1.ANO1.780.1 assembled CDS
MVRCVIQRVLSSSVKVGETTVGCIQNGLLVLVGIEPRDNQDDIDWMSKKISNAKLFADEQGRPWKKSVKSSGYSILLVSQFTLHAKLKGNGIDVKGAMKPDEAKVFFDKFVAKVSGEMGDTERVKTGEFGAYMEVSLVNDGPVTLLVDSQTVGFKRRIKRPEVNVQKNTIEKQKSEISKNQLKKMAKKEKKKALRNSYQQETSSKAIPTESSVESPHHSSADIADLPDSMAKVRL